MKKVQIWGISGQAGPYLARQFLDRGYEVIGVVRRISHPNLDFIKEYRLEKVKLIEGDLSDDVSIYNAIDQIKPDIIINLAAQSHVATSFNQPLHTSDITAIGVLRLLEAIRQRLPRCKFINCSSSEMFGDVVTDIQNEKTEFRPRSPYAVAKVFAHHSIKVYRESYNLFAIGAIFFNMEGPRRGERFVTKKITDYIGRYVNGLIDSPLELGAVDSRRDWGYVNDYMAALVKMIESDVADDYVVATGETHSVREFCNVAFFEATGHTLQWKGQGVNEEAYDEDGKLIIQINPEFYRPAEVPLLRGDATKIKNALGWEPTVSFEELVKMMVKYDIERYSLIKGAEHVNS